MPFPRCRRRFRLARYRKQSDFATHLFQPLATISDRAVLNGGSDNVIAALHQPKDAQVVGLSAAAGKNNFRRTRIHQRRYRCSRLFHRRPRVLAIMVNRRRIAELLQVKRPHRLKHLRQDRGGGIVIEVNAAHGSILLLFSVIPSAAREPYSTHAQDSWTSDRKR